MGDEKPWVKIDLELDINVMERPSSSCLLPNFVVFPVSFSASQMSGNYRDVTRQISVYEPEPEPNLRERTIGVELRLMWAESQSRNVNEIETKQAFDTFGWKSSISISVPKGR